MGPRARFGLSTLAVGDLCHERTGTTSSLEHVGWSHRCCCVSPGPAQGAPSQYSSYQQGQGQQYGSYRASQTGPSAQQQRPYGYEQARRSQTVSVRTHQSLLRS